MKKLVLVGPWGGLNGENWSFKASGKIIKINISHGSCIDSISFTSQDEDGNVHGPKRFGGRGGDHHVEVSIDLDVEELNCISGTIGHFASKMILTSLSFSTNVHKFGPFGKENGVPFSLPVGKGSFAGFYGCSSRYIDSIGVYLKGT